MTDLLRKIVKWYYCNVPTLVAKRFLTTRDWLWKEPQLVEVRPRVRMKVDVRDFTQRDIYMFGGIHRDIIAFMEQYLKPGMCVFDVGASVGFYTLISAWRVGRKGAVHAFEPQPTIFRLLEDDVRMNGFSSFVAVNQLALSNKSGRVWFEFGTVTHSGMGHFARGTVLSHFEQVETMTLDEYVRWKNISAIDYLKIDVEGAEMLVLQGAGETLTRCRPRIIQCEVSHATYQRFGFCPIDVIQILQGYGYNPYHLTGGELSPVTAYKPADDADLHVDIIFCRDSS